MNTFIDPLLPSGVEVLQRAFHFSGLWLGICPCSISF